MSPEPNAASREQIEALLTNKPYRLVRLIGQGAMGEVWLVRNTSLEIDMALKVLHARHLQSQFHRERFLLEARGTAAIVHPNVVKVTDYWEGPGVRPCFVMQLLTGQTLARELRSKTRLPPEEVIEIGCQVASALQAVHAAGLVHRDVKPENLYLHEAGSGNRVVKLLDFGLARVVSPDAQTGPLLPSLATQTGSMVGSPRYMSPEALRGEHVDPRADIYSLGVVLYMTLVGRNYVFDWATRPVFSPPSQMGIAKVSPQLDAAILRAVEQRAEDRFQSAQELLMVLQALRAARAQTGWSLPRGFLKDPNREDDP